MVILNKKIPIIHIRGLSSQKNKHGSDKSNDATQTFFHQNLSASTPHNAFPKTIQITNPKEIINPDFQEKFTINQTKERITILINSIIIIKTIGIKKSFFECSFENLKIC